MVYITPWIFQNRSNYPPKVFLKNYSKSQKNHKMENPIVLDSKWVDLHSEHIIWYILVFFFCCSFRSMLFFIVVKKWIKAYHIICSQCRSTHLESNTIEFSILWFFCDLLWFFETNLGGNLTGFGKFRGWYRPFHRLGVLYSTLHSWEGDIYFFHHNLIIMPHLCSWVFLFGTHLHVCWRHQSCHFLDACPGFSPPYNWLALRKLIVSDLTKRVC